MDIESESKSVRNTHTHIDCGDYSSDSGVPFAIDGHFRNWCVTNKAQINRPTHFLSISYCWATIAISVDGFDKNTNNMKHPIIIISYNELQVEPIEWQFDALIASPNNVSLVSQLLKLLYTFFLLIQKKMINE